LARFANNSSMSHRCQLTVALGTVEIRSLSEIVSLEELFLGPKTDNRGTEPCNGYPWIFRIKYFKKILNCKVTKLTKYSEITLQSISFDFYDD
jgi:hypothetical protein